MKARDREYLWEENMVSSVARVAAGLLAVVGLAAFGLDRRKISQAGSA
jgi:hypothetical protein